MDQRIADYIRDHRGKYTREALTQQLLDAGYTREAIDATWAVLDTPDPDDTAGEGFWGRFFLVLIGINVAVLVLVGLGTGSFSSPERLGLLAILGVALGIGALIAWGVVALVGPIEDGSYHGDGHRLRDPARLLAAHRWQLLRAAERASDRRRGAARSTLEVEAEPRARADRDREVHRLLRGGVQRLRRAAGHAVRDRVRRQLPAHRRSGHGRCRDRRHLCRPGSRDRVAKLEHVCGAIGARLRGRAAAGAPGR